MTVLMTHFVLDAPPPKMASQDHTRSLHENLNLLPVKLSYDEILERLERIGDGWHLRSEHAEGTKKRASTKAKLEGKRTHVWLFMRGDEEMGFCVAVKNGFDASLAEKFGIAARGTEIWKIGLYPEYAHKGYGHVFLPGIQTTLMDGQRAVKSKDIPELKGSDRIYLNTRDSNDTDSRNFYKKHGWQLHGQEVFIEPGSEHTELSHILVPNDRDCCDSEERRVGNDRRGATGGAVASIISDATGVVRRPFQPLATFAPE